MPEPRSKQACEPCRRKKSKCTAERPVCSFCKRLNQPCVYRTPEPPRLGISKPSREAKNTKKNDLQDRFQMLESQVRGIYQLLQPPSTGGSDSSLNTSTSVTTMTSPSQPQSSFASNNAPEQQQGLLAGATFSALQPDPPSEVLDHFIKVYCIKLHLQPLQLFELAGLREHLLTSPQFLRWSFLALILQFSSHEFYSGREAEATEFYTTSSRQAVTSLASQGIPRLEVVQALSLMVLIDVAACRPCQAWMSIGTLSRLETLRKLLQHGSVDSSSGQEIDLKCHWTVFVLEQTFAPQQCTASQDDETFDYPASAPIPPPLPPVDNSECPADLFSEDAVEDLGITTYYIRLIGLWGHLSSYMHQVRTGKAGTAWAPGSLHNILCAKIFEDDSTRAHRHLLRNVRFFERSSAELHEQCEYWIPWVLMQVISHAIPAIVNHPFIHLVAMRDRPKGPQSYLFLQQTVDQALHHSAWVPRLLRYCEAQSFEINDPLVGQLVAVVATIPWLFQRASDPKVAQKAKDDLDWCKGYLARLSTTWPHVSHKLKILQDLDSIADNNAQAPSDKGVSIVFHPALFWALVDPKISQMTPTMPSREASGRLQDATIRVSTHYIHPILDNQVEPQIQTQIGGDDPFLLSDESLEQVYLDNLFTQFLPYTDQMY